MKCKIVYLFVFVLGLINEKVTRMFKHNGKWNREMFVGINDLLHGQHT